MGIFGLRSVSADLMFGSFCGENLDQVAPGDNGLSQSETCKGFQPTEKQ